MLRRCWPGQRARATVWGMTARKILFGCLGAFVVLFLLAGVSVIVKSCREEAAEKERKRQAACAHDLREAQRSITEHDARTSLRLVTAARFDCGPENKAEIERLQAQVDALQLGQ